MPKAPWDDRREPTPEEIERRERPCITCDHHLATIGGSHICDRPLYVIADRVRGNLRICAHKDCEMERAGGLIGWIHSLFNPSRCGVDGRFWAPYRRRGEYPPRTGSGGVPRPMAPPDRPLGARVPDPIRPNR